MSRLCLALAQAEAPPRSRWLASRAWLIGVALGRHSGRRVDARKLGLTREGLYNQIPR